MTRPSLLRALVLGLLILCPALVGAATTALDDYVATADPSYGTVRADTRTGNGYTVFVLNLTSLTWRAPQEVDRVLWRHDLLIASPGCFTRGATIPPS